MFHYIRVPVLDFGDLKGTYLHACLCPKQCSSTYFLSSIPLISSVKSAKMHFSDHTSTNTSPEPRFLCLAFNFRNLQNGFVPSHIRQDMSVSNINPKYYFPIDIQPKIITGLSIRIQ